MHPPWPLHAFWPLQACESPLHPPWPLHAFWPLHECFDDVDEHDALLLDVLSWSCEHPVRIAVDPIAIPPIGARKNVNGILSAPAPVFWNIEKKGQS